MKVLKLTTSPLRNMNLFFSFAGKMSHLRIFFGLCFLFFSVYSINAATVTSRTGAKTWNVKSSWVNGLVPTSNDDVVIVSGSTMTVSAVTSCKSVTINSGGTLMINADLTVSGAITNSGTLTITKPLRQTGASTFSNSGSITVTSSAIVQSGTADFRNNSGASITFGGTVASDSLCLTGSFINAGTLNLSGAKVSFVGVNTAASQVAGFTTTGDVVYQRSLGSVTFMGNISGKNLTISSGTLNLGNGLAHNLSGFFSQSGGTVNGGTGTTLVISYVSIITAAWWTEGGTFNPGTSTVIFSGAGYQYINGIQFTTFYNLTFGGSGAKVLSKAPVVNNVFSMEGTATSAVAPTYGASATLQYKGTGSRTTGNEFPNDFSATGGIIVDQGAGSIVTLNASKTAFAGNINVKSGTFDIQSYTINRVTSGGRLTLASGASLKISGTNTLPSNYSTHSIDRASTIEYAGSNQVVANLNSSQVYGNLILSGSGTKTIQSGVNAVAGQLNIGAGTILSMTDGQNLSLGGTVTKTGTWIVGSTPATTIEYAGGDQQVVIPDNAAKTYGNLKFSGAGTKTLPTGKLKLTGDLTVSGTASVSALSTSLNIGGSFSLGSGTQFAAGNVADTLKGNFTNNGGTFTSGTSTFVFNGTSAQTIGGTTTAAFNNLTVDNAAGVLLGTNDTTTVKGTLLINIGKKLQLDPATQMRAALVTNNAGTSGIVVKTSATAAEASFIFTNPAANPVQATVEMYSKAAATIYVNGKYSNYQWQFFTVPLQSIAANPTFAGSYIRQYNEKGNGYGTGADKRWIDLTNGSVLTPFKGYELTQATPKTIVFRGTLVNSDFNSGQLSFTTSGDYPGQHIFGNPYTAAIDIKKMNFGSDMEKTVYMYNAGSLADWVNGGSGAISGETPGQYISAPQNLAGIGGIPKQIPSMQGFLVKAINGGSANSYLNIPYSSVMKNADRQRVRSSEVSLTDENKVSTIVEVKGSRFTDRVWLFVNGDCSRTYDNGWDASKIMMSSSAVPSIYDVESDGNYQINTMNDLNNTQLGFTAGEDSVYTLTFTHSNLSPKYASLYLIDTQLGTTTDISQSGSQYTFTAKASASTSNTRFRIITNTESITDNKEMAIGKTMNLTSSKQIVVVDNPNAIPAELTIFDTSGRMMKKYPIRSNEVTSISTGLETGAYIARLSGNGGVITKRIIIEN